jgi:hypothetical protein
MRFNRLTGVVSMLRLCSTGIATGKVAFLLEHESRLGMCSLEPVNGKFPSFPTSRRILRKDFEASPYFLQ